jgi:hypothetical protein
MRALSYQGAINGEMRIKFHARRVSESFFMQGMPRPILAWGGVGRDWQVEAPGLT